MGKFDNIDGRFVRWENEFLPAGSWRETSRNARILRENGQCTLYADLKNANGGWNNSQSVTFRPAGPWAVKFENRDGNFHQTETQHRHPGRGRGHNGHGR